MNALRRDGPAPETGAVERGAPLALLPIAATFGYYLLPSTLQNLTSLQFGPQILAYAAMAWWATQNSAIGFRVGLRLPGIYEGLRWGLITGLLLGFLNTCVILAVFPSLGYDITFLKHTPHARVPFFVMMPWFICAIALFVELNFRGFLVGRLAALEAMMWTSKPVRRLSPLALILSTLTFAFDPFMVNTFRDLHWIAVWDGLVWGLIWLRTRNLFMTIVAHAVEVMVMYLAVRMALTGE